MCLQIIFSVDLQYFIMKQAKSVFLKSKEKVTPKRLLIFLSSPISTKQISFSKKQREREKMSWPSLKKQQQFNAK